MYEPDHARLAAQDPEGRLFNPDLAPARPEERRWGTYSLFSLWMNVAHNAGNYTFAAGLFLLGLSPINIVLGLLGGTLLTFLACNLSGFMGQQTGAPYPVVSRISWGTRGANVPALVRAAVGIAWYGIQTYLASIALKLLVLRFFPGLDTLTEHHFAGLDLLGWLAFLALWAIQLAIITSGMEVVRHFQGFAGPTIWIIMLALGFWMLWQANFDISWTTGGKELTSSETWYWTFATVGLALGIQSGLILNFSDFARFAPNRRSIIIGNFLGIPLNWTAFALTSVIVSAASVAVYGEAVLDPAELLERIENDYVALFGVAVFLVAMFGINIIANFVSPAFDLANVWPKHISFKRGGIIAALLAVVSMPWNLFSSPAVITYFIGGLGALLGPFFGVMAVDYFLLRRQRIALDDLYLPTEASEYHYHRGVNPLAVIAAAPAGIFSLIVALVPSLHLIAPFSWLIGAGIAAAIYYLVGRGRIPAAPATSVASVGEHVRATELP